MKTYEDYEKQYNKLLKEAILTSPKADYVVKKEIWIGFQLCEDENKIPNNSKEFIEWFESLEVRLYNCVASTIVATYEMKQDE